MIIDWPIAITLTLFVLVLALLLQGAFAAKRRGGGGGERKRRLDFRKGTTYEKPQDEGAVIPSRDRKTRKRGNPPA
jgi:hypothetical protein